MGRINPCPKAAGLIERIRIGIGMPRESAAQALEPLLDACRAYTHACSASHACHPGALPCPLIGRLTVAGMALDFRRSRILPPHAAPEEIAARAHRWTYAVLVAALLHPAGVARAASPGAGGLCEPEGAASDRARSAHVQVVLAHESMPDARLLFRRMVPAGIHAWLAADPQVCEELQGFLAGEMAAQSGAIGLLVGRAAAQCAGVRADVCRPGAAVADKMVVAQTTPSKQGTGLPAASAPFASRPVTKAAQGAVAQRFIRWVSSGIGDASLRFNQPGAMVHFVQEGMLLVSPRIFREYALAFGEGGEGSDGADGGKGRDGAALAGDADRSRLGLGIQRAVIRAGWHRRAARGTHIHAFEQVRNAKPVSVLSGVLIEQPQRFVDPLPAANPYLRRRESS